MIIVFFLFFFQVIFNKYDGCIHKSSLNGVSVLECPHIPSSALRTDVTEPELMIKVLESFESQPNCQRIDFQKV